MSGRALGVLAAAALLGALLSGAFLAPVPSYDPTAWLLWGRELTGAGLDTREGPAFKPLPVLVCALLAPLGGAAAETWVLIARTGALLAVGLAARLAWGWGGAPAAVVAGVGVLVSGGWVSLSAAGASEGLLVALALGAVLAWREGAPRWALGLAAAAALVRVEAWPFAMAAAVVHARRAPGDRAALAAVAVAVGALWFVPEWLASGDVLRSGARARIAEPGQPALAGVPALASVADAARLVPWCTAAGLLGLLGARGGGDPGPRRLALAALAWIALVAAMAQLGFSGEARYALPGVALLAVPAGVGAARVLARAPRAGGLAVGAALVAAAAPWATGLADLSERFGHQARLAGDLERAIALSGGTAGVRRCGRPYVGRLRGPLLAYALRVPKREVGFDPAPPGVVFASRLFADAPVAPPAGAGGGRVLVRAGEWRVSASCLADLDS